MDMQEPVISILDKLTERICTYNRLTGVAAVAAKGVLSIFGGNPGQWIQDSMTAGKNFIDASMAAGVKFLNKLMGISQL